MTADLIARLRAGTVTPADLDDAADALALTLSALRIIAGREQCIDNLMGNVDVATWTLDRLEGRECP
jgi:hypothetical protein